MNQKTRIWVAGQHGMVGKAVYELLKLSGYANVISSPRRVPDLTDQADTLSWMKTKRPEVVVMAAGRVGGILGNSTYPVEFLLDNARMACNVVEGAARVGVNKLLYLGSSCIYPRNAPQPMRPEHLMSSPLEPTNEGYALAKILGVKLCQFYRQEYGFNFITAMPCNLYGPGDRYHEKDSHVIPALIQKFAMAAEGNLPSVLCLGDGSPKREFLYVEDLAAACLVLLKQYDGKEIVNVGSGICVTIKELAHLIKDVTHYRGKIEWTAQASMNGTPVKVMDSSVMRSLGWQSQIPLSTGLDFAYRDYKKRLEQTIDVRDEEMPRWLRESSSSATGSASTSPHYPCPETQPLSASPSTPNTSQ